MLAELSFIKHKIIHYDIANIFKISDNLEWIF